MVILIAEDEPSIRRALELLLKSEHDVICCEDGAQALLELSRTSIDLVITDFQMPMVSGLELIKRGKEISPATAFIMMTAFGSTNQAVEAIQLGADDYFGKPFDVSEMKHRIRKIEELRSYKIEKTLGADEVAKRLVGESKFTQDAAKFITAAASSTSPVLLTGPRGTGKEFIARSIHDSGQRSIYPFIQVDCGATNPDNLEAELFGFEKESSTKAGFPKPGKFELARGGTLFLQGVTSLPVALQSRLVPVLRDSVFTRLGGTRPIHCNTRVIATSASPIKPLVDSGAFRDELYYQIGILTLDIPALCDRKEDIPAFVKSFWAKISREVKTNLQLAPETLECLAHYHYPGNLRELKNILERLAVIGSESGFVTPDLLPGELRGGAKPAVRGLDNQLLAFEKKMLFDTMTALSSDEKRAAEALELSVEELRKRLGRHGWNPKKKAA